MFFIFTFVPTISYMLAVYQPKFLLAPLPLTLAILIFFKPFHSKYAVFTKNCYTNQVFQC